MATRTLKLSDILEITGGRAPKPGEPLQVGNRMWRVVQAIPERNIIQLED